jgi:hypothetical protein
MLQYDSMMLQYDIVLLSEMWYNAITGKGDRAESIEPETGAVKPLRLCRNQGEIASAPYQTDYLHEPAGKLIKDAPPE